MGQSQSGCRAVTGDVQAGWGGGFWRLEMRLGLVFGYGNAFGVELVQWGRGPFKRFPTLPLRPPKASKPPPQPRAPVMPVGHTHAPVLFRVLLPVSVPPIAARRAVDVGQRRDLRPPVVGPAHPDLLPQQPNVFRDAGDATAQGAGTRGGRAAAEPVQRPPHSQTFVSGFARGSLR